MDFSLNYGLGIFLATVASFSFALQYICVRYATDGGRLPDVIFISLLVNVAVMVPLTGIFYGLPSVSSRAIIAFGTAGIVGSLLARICMFKSIDIIGASRTAPVVASNVFFATVLAVLIFGEELTAAHAVGIVFIVAGVAVISWETARDPTGVQRLSELGVTLILPLLAAVFLGLEPIFVSIGLDTGTPVIPGFAIKATAATIGFIGYLLWTQVPISSMVEWGPHTKWYLGAGVTSTIGIGTYFSALSVAPVIIVIPLLQTAPLIVVVISALFLPRRLEAVTWRLVVASSVVVGGAAIVSVSG